MKNIYKVIAIIIIISLLIFNCYYFDKKLAYADALTISQVAGLSYALGDWMGLSFNWNNGTSSQVQGWIENKVNNYLAGRDLSEVFGAEIARIVAGDLYIPFQLYNGIHDFLENLIQSNGISTDTDIGGMYGDLTYGENSSSNRNFGTGSWDIWQTSGGTPKYYYWNGQAYNNGSAYGRSVRTDGTRYSGTSIVSENVMYTVSSGLFVKVSYTISADRIDSFTVPLPSQTGNISSVKATVDNFNNTVLNPEKEWVGRIGGQSIPDTNLDDLIGNIYDDIADNNLSVEGEIVDLPVPGPTPAPAPTPVADVIDGLNTQIGQLDGIGNDIGDIAGHLDDLGTIEEQQTEVLEGINEGIQDIPDAIGTQTGVISGAIDQAIGAVQSQTGTISGAIDQAISDITAATETAAEGTIEAVESLEGTLTDALDVPTTAEVANYKFDLSTLFPFCIPFDIARMLNAFDGVAAAPHFRIPINISSIGFSYNMDLDFAIFDTVAAVLRQVELIAFAIALAFATSKVIRW